MRVSRKGLNAGEMAKNEENVVGGGSERSLDSNTAKFEQGAALVEAPGNGGAKGNRALETVFFAARRRGQSRKAVRVKDEEDAAVIFASEFADHQGAESSGSFPVDVASAIGGHIIAERVEILAAAFGESLHGALNAGENLEEFWGGFDTWIDESLGGEIEAAGFLQKPKRETGDDAEGVLAVDAALGKKKRHRLRDGFLPGEIWKIDGRFEHDGRGSVLLRDAFDAKRERGQSQLFVSEFEGSANGFAGENVFGKLQAHLNAGECDGREKAGHEDGSDEAGENQEEKVVAGIEGGHGDEDDPDDVDPAFHGDAILHAIADPAKRGAFGEDRDQSDSDPRGDEKSDQSRSAGKCNIAKLCGCAGIQREDEGDAEGGDGEEESADGGAVGVLPEGGEFGSE